MVENLNKFIKGLSTEGHAWMWQVAPPSQQQPQKTPAENGSGWDQQFTMDIIERLDALEVRVASQLDQLTSAHEERISAIKVSSSTCKFCLAMFYFSTFCEGHRSTSPSLLNGMQALFIHHFIQDFGCIFSIAGVADACEVDVCV